MTTKREESKFPTMDYDGNDEEVSIRPKRKVSSTLALQQYRSKKSSSKIIKFNASPKKREEQKTIEELDDMLDSL